MHGDQVRAAGPGGPDGPGHGVGDVVELEVQKDPEVRRAVLDGSHHVGTLGHEELETDLEHADVTTKLGRCLHGARPVGDVEGDDETVSRGRHIHGR